MKGSIDAILQARNVGGRSQVNVKAEFSRAGVLEVLDNLSKVVEAGGVLNRRDEHADWE